MSEFFVVKLRGLPWSVTADEIITFFDPIEVKGGANGIHMPTGSKGKPSGEAFVEFNDADDLSAAEDKNKEHIGRRYIEVFRAKHSELQWFLRREHGNNGENTDDCCVRLRGLPFNCSKEEISNFFSGMEIVPNGISLEHDFNGRATGEAYIQFLNSKMAARAKEKHKEKIGHRYIEIFDASLDKVEMVNRGPDNGGCPPMRGGPPSFNGPPGGGNFQGGFNGAPGPFNNMGGNMGGGPGPFNNMGGGFNNRSAPYDARERLGGNNRINRGGGGRDDFGGNRQGNFGREDGGMRGSKEFDGHRVHMRGLPFKASDGDIADFFAPLDPVNVIISTDNTGRPSGEADVEFGSHQDAVRAMDRHKANMKHRYIELFLNSSPRDDGPSGGGANLKWGQNQGDGNMGVGGGNFNMGGHNSGNFGMSGQNDGNSGGDQTSGNSGMGDGNGGNFSRGGSNSGNNGMGHANTGIYGMGNSNAGNYGMGGNNSGNYGLGGNNMGNHGMSGNNPGNYGMGNANSGNYGIGDGNNGNYGMGGNNQGNYGIEGNNPGNCSMGGNNSGNYGMGGNNQGNYGVGDKNKGNYGMGDNNTGNYGASGGNSSGFLQGRLGQSSMGKMKATGRSGTYTSTDGDKQSGVNQSTFNNSTDAPYTSRDNSTADSGAQRRYDGQSQGTASNNWGIF